jgi:hypothetical protein
LVSPEKDAQHSCDEAIHGRPEVFLLPDIQDESWIAAKTKTS